MAKPASILIILTSASSLSKNGEHTGVWLEELTTPYYLFVDAGATVTLGSIKGGPVPIDPNSEQNPGPHDERFKADSEANAALKASLPISQVQIDDFDAIFLPGGHGTMADLPQSQVLAEKLSSAWQQGKVLAAVCHGPAGLLNVQDRDGQALVKGRQVTGFSNGEEQAVGMQDTVPFLLEDRLRELGALYDSKADFQRFALRDGRLITGQNPASSALTAMLTLEALGLRPDK